MRIGITLAAILITLSQASSARADGWFFSEGFGGSEVDDQLGEYFDGSLNFRVALGRRFGRWAVEGFVMGNMLDGVGELESGFHSATGYGLSARYMFPVGRWVELYVRGGLHKMHLDVDTGSFEDATYSGRAIHYGAGAQIKGKVPLVGLLFYPLLFTDIGGPKVTASLWIETNHQYTRLHHPEWSSIDGRIQSLTMGFGVGTDF